MTIHRPCIRRRRVALRYLVSVSVSVRVTGPATTTLTLTGRRERLSARALRAGSFSFRLVVPAGRSLTDLPSVVAVPSRFAVARSTVSVIVTRHAAVLVSASVTPLAAAASFCRLATAWTSGAVGAGGGDDAVVTGGGELSWGRGSTVSTSSATAVSPASSVTRTRTVRAPAVAKLSRAERPLPSSKPSPSTSQSYVVSVASPSGSVPAA